MSLTLYMDHHMDARIVAALRRLGLDIVTAREDQTARLADEQLLERATALGRALCSEDKDFFRITSRWWREHRDFAGVIHVDRLGASIGTLVEAIALVAESYTPEDIRNRLVYVPL